MESLRDTEENLKVISSLKDITSAYQTLSNMRMNKIEAEVLNTRKFLEGVAQIYYHAKAAYLSSSKEGNGNGQPESISFLRKNKKKITVFLSADERFYGTLLLDTWKEVQKYLQNNESDLVVTGEIGKNFIKNNSSLSTSHFFSLDDENPTPEEVKKIFDFINDYEEIVVFHGKFYTPFRQDPVKTSVSGGVSFEETPEKPKNYLFEPSPEIILRFFENEIREALFKQAVLEHQLARFASRMIAMDQATQNADKKIKKLHHKANRLQKQEQNKKQINRIIRSNLNTQL